MRGNEDDRMATTWLYRCDLNTFSLYQQFCSIIEAVQLSGKIYIYIYIYRYFNYAEVTSLGVILCATLSVPFPPTISTPH